MAQGVEADITELSTGANGVIVGLDVRGPRGSLVANRVLFHVYLVRDGQIMEIRRYDDRHSAALAAGLSA
jgi:ketosteroid isomerase-like protein